jgi:four helix bundle protein
MNPRADQLRSRTKQFALRIIRLSRSIAQCPEGKVIGNQLLRCGTAVGANYRAACRARSDPDFVSKIGVVLEEADETVYWLELLVESKLIKQERIASLLNEANQLVAIFAASKKTASDFHRQPGQS